MDRPMRAYGLNVVEQTLDDLLAGFGLLLALFALVAGILGGTFAIGGVGGGLLLAATATAGVLLALGGSGIRQNGAASDLGYALLAVAAAGWLIAAIGAGALAAWLGGILADHAGLEATLYACAGLLGAALLLSLALPRGRAL
ncbi:MAG: hypothetical protein ACRDLN_05855, partial [Solirubrobacteraceae bacterium]